MQKANEMAEVSANLIVATLVQVVETIATIVRYHTAIQVMAAVDAAVPLLEAPKRGPGRPKKVRNDFDDLFSQDDVPVKKPRKRRAKQLCPVPGCKGLAAPYFGMVCKNHKDVGKSKIAAYRKQRKAAKISSKKTSAKKTSSKKISAKKAGSKKVGIKKTGAKKIVAKKAVKKVGAKKVGVKKTVAKKTDTKAGAKKAGVKKVAVEKSDSEKYLEAKNLVDFSMEAEGIMRDRSRDRSAEKDDPARLR